MKVGEVASMRTCSVVSGTTTFTFRSPSKTTRMVFLYLGHEDANNPLDQAALEARLGMLGWVKKPGGSF